MRNEFDSSPDYEQDPTTDMTESAGCHSARLRLAGAFFPQCHNLRVIGGTFTSKVHIHQAVQSPREHFQWIGRGEIDLRRRFDQTGNPGYHITAYNDKQHRHVYHYAFFFHSTRPPAQALIAGHGGRRALISFAYDKGVNSRPLSAGDHGRESGTASHHGSSAIQSRRSPGVER
ncbi:hypothetical protein FB45DRAFT_867993 [Roridomyces roridus]|uniref:Uncharacterized protein n=1 Tax=Roridomyces roridus TaxID=1738132 RepID=A0AAD7BSI7_9AGAR|nr:hypothetical protein FB45DRAFT_867993 [Roridomyces roridus]